MKPDSLFYGQLADRGINDADRRADLMLVLSDASSSPTPEEAAPLIAASNQPGPVLAEWIDHVNDRFPLSIDKSGAKTVDEIPPQTPAPAVPPQTLAH